MLASWRSKVLQNAPLGAFCITFDLHIAIISLENRFWSSFWVAAWDRFYCRNILLNFSIFSGAEDAVLGCFAQNQTSVKLPYFSKHSKEYFSVSKHQCTVCGKCFGSNKDVRRHMLVHTGEKPYSCDICGRRFTQKSSMKTHRTIHFKHIGI